MFFLDTALAAREASGRPIRVGVVGGGFMGRGIAQQLGTPLTGLRLGAISSRRPDAAQQACAESGITDTVFARAQGEFDAAVAAGRTVTTTDASLVCQSTEIDAVIEVTGETEFGTQVAVEVISCGKHLVLMNAEVDATIGPVLKARADQAGVIYTNVDGDEPGLIMNMHRHLKAIGFKPVLAGNLKGFLNHYRTPDTQVSFAERTKQRPQSVCVYADGTKLSLESCLVANATGMQVAQRGMIGPQCAHVKDIIKHFDPEELLRRPLVDFALSPSEPPSGAFVVGYADEPGKQHYMRYLKMGDGPLYVFYTPYVLPHIEVPMTVARAVLFHDAAITPLGAPVCEVITMAKREMRAGEELDGPGGYTYYGSIENAEIARREDLLPLGLAEGCRLVRDVPIDAAITYDDVEAPSDRLCHRLRAEQDRMFPVGRGANGQINGAGHDPRLPKEMTTI